MMISVMCVRILSSIDQSLDFSTLRVIRMDQGHALLVGVGGSGRQSLARLAAFTAGYEVFEITLSRGYGEDELREDLKQLYYKLGLENKKVHHVCTCICVYVCMYVCTLCMYVHVHYEKASI